MSSKHSAERSIADITTRFQSRFREQLRPIRKIGKEAEFPVVRRDGHAGDAAAILRALVDQHGFAPQFDGALLIAARREEMEIAIEVGSGTLEMAFRPCDDLWELRRDYEQTLALVQRVAESCGQYLLGFGIQPRARASLALMTPRKHYRALYRAIGAPWLKLTTTAADQTHVDVCRSELLDAINYMNLLSAPIIALCANSSIYAGRAGMFVSGREGLLRGLGDERYGMPRAQFKSLEEFIHSLCEYECYVLSERHRFKPFGAPFTKYLSSHTDPEPFQEFLWHEHYVWNSARARVKTSTIEVRPACQPPPNEPLAANALILGWVESLPQIAAYFSGALGDDAWSEMRAYRRAAVRDGLDAREPAPNMIRDLVKISEGGLRRRGRGEEGFLTPIWERIERKESPGVRAREILRREGIGGLIERMKIGQG